MADDIKVDKERLVNAIKELFFAFNTTPPDEIIGAIIRGLNQPNFQLDAKQIIAQVQEQYVQMAEQLRLHVLNEMQRAYEEKQSRGTQGGSNG